jgi:hypothetical protein
MTESRVAAKMWRSSVAVRCFENRSSRVVGSSHTGRGTMPSLASLARPAASESLSRNIPAQTIEAADIT